MEEREWQTYPDNWLSDWNGCMLSYMEGSDHIAVECASFNPSPLYGRPEWSFEYEQGYRYYVLVWDVYDSDKRNVSFYKDAVEAQVAFEKARDPLGKHA